MTQKINPDSPLNKKFAKFFIFFWKYKKSVYLCNPKREIKFLNNAEIAQLVEHNLAKVGVASSSLVFRSKLIKPHFFKWGFLIWYSGQYHLASRQKTLKFCQDAMGFCQKNSLSLPSQQKSAVFCRDATAIF